ncbi:hypothetical protein Tco_1576345 [Tanacetum coccineum]
MNVRNGQLVAGEMMEETSLDNIKLATKSIFKIMSGTRGKKGVLVLFSSILFRLSSPLVEYFDRLQQSGGRNVYIRDLIDLEFLTSMSCLCEGEAVELLEDMRNKAELEKSTNQEQESNCNAWSDQGEANE